MHCFVNVSFSPNYASKHSYVTSSSLTIFLNSLWICLQRICCLRHESKVITAGLLQVSVICRKTSFDAPYQTKYGTSGRSLHALSYSIRIILSRTKLPKAGFRSLSATAVQATGFTSLSTPPNYHTPGTLDLELE